MRAGEGGLHVVSSVCADRCAYGVFRVGCGVGMVWYSVVYASMVCMCQHAVQDGWRRAAGSEGWHERRLETPALLVVDGHSSREKVEWKVMTNPVVEIKLMESGEEETETKG